MGIFSVAAGQIIFAFIIGGILGLERELKSKAAGFRTMILISVGSCLLTIISKEVANAGGTDRIASNIVTGIGFLGGGVIFKEGISVKGLTTAALIWITAALGMAIGYHEYAIVILVTIIVFTTLMILEPIHRFIDKFKNVKDYKIVTDGAAKNLIKDLEAFFKSHHLDFRCLKVMKENKDSIYFFE
jgi:putative Mg2+ transporter-C (MgtC) family protein